MRSQTGNKHIRIEEIDLQVDSPLPYDIYSTEGTLLLKRGFVVHSGEQLARLIARGAFGIEPEVLAARDGLRRDDSEQPAPRRVEVSVLGRIGEARASLDALFTTPDSSAPFPDRVRDIAAKLQEACRLDSDAALASIMIDRTLRYSIRHSVNTALMAEIVLLQIQPDGALRLPTIAAALTMNIAMLELQDALYSQATPLTPEQKSQIVQHTHHGRTMLAARGVEDGEWLDAVAQHHEMIDGSGYPQRLADTAVGAGARMLALCEQYCAVISERSYRPAILPNVALRKLYLQKGTFDIQMAGLLIRVLGLHPPGTLVRLANGDTAIVLKRIQDAAHPVVRGLVGGHGKPLEGYPKRSTHKPMFAIGEALPASSLRISIDLAALWADSTVTATED